MFDKYEDLYHDDLYYDRDYDDGRDDLREEVVRSIEYLIEDIEEDGLIPEYREDLKKLVRRAEALDADLDDIDIDKYL